MLRALIWLLRFCMVVVAYFVAGAVYNRGWWWALAPGAIAISVLWLLCIIIENGSPEGIAANISQRRDEWIIDADGERQKVDHIVRGTRIVVPTSRSLRIVEEAYERDKRRTGLWRIGLLGWGSAFYAIFVYFNFRVDSPWMPGVILFGVLALALIPYFFWLLGAEFFYLAGYQDMKGAKVLDPAPVRPGLREVQAEKVHGDARLATKDEARNILNPRS